MLRKGSGHLIAVIVVSSVMGIASAQGAGDVGEIKTAVSACQVSLAKAVEIAQQQHPQAKIIQAELETDESPPFYEVEALEGESIQKLRIDGVSGKVMRTKTKKELDEDDDKEIAEARRAHDQSKADFKAAMDAAVKTSPGATAIGVKIGTTDGKTMYKVKLFSEDKIVKVKLDGGAWTVLKREEKDLPAAQWRFDGQGTGAAPKGWSLEETNPSKSPGTWTLTTDPTAPKSEGVLNLTTRNTGHTYNLAIADQTSFADIDLRVRVKANSGKEDQGGGMVWRYRDANNYYICRLNPLEGNYRVYKVVDGKRLQLHSAEVATQAGAWYRLRATMTGDRIACYLDNQKLLEARDDTLKQPGRIGLWTKADASSSFDDFVAYSKVQEKED